MKPEAVPPCVTGLETGMADAIMTEIAERLSALAETGDETTIDLRSLPTSDADRDALEARLGQGEVTATLDVAGLTEVRETAYAGVWWIRHMGAGDKIAAEEIAITRAPEILLSHVDDVRRAAEKIERDTAADDSHPNEEEALHA